ncbi:RNA-guided endonuclease InsQ/TnpB family protein [Marinobacter gelidimuriae]|uniref:RNA-guided endonuclease InsQ/TnpB family protein n=1 Tax=Marinobacter gelidimuriae TaxID=2739064 RepID=UPI0003604C50|nr:RNA-guided endonuclease TnpB family protein [Marinobacter gelidimuriae]
MIVRQGFKYRLDTNDAQSARLRVLCGHARFVWNQALALCNEAAQTEGQYVPRYESMAKWVTDWKKDSETEWLKEAYTDNLQQKLKDLDTAWQRYFKKIGNARRPRFKKKGRSRDSIRFVNFHKYCKLEGRRVKLPSGLGWITFCKSRDILGTVKNCTIGFDGGHWFISFQTERQIDQPKHSSRSMVGLDLGVTRFFTLSDGTVKEPASSFKAHQHRLTRAQRALAKKVKFSANWQKQKARINRIHTRIASVRRDYLHKTSTTISKNHAMIVIEDLKVSNMSRSAKGTTENPGTNVAAKSGLNRSILDQGWHEFRRQLTYKQAFRGGEVLAVPAHYTSQTCPVCQHISADNRKTQARFECVECGFSENADLVGAINIKARGHRVLACGESALAAR